MHVQPRTMRKRLFIGAQVGILGTRPCVRAEMPGTEHIPSYGAKEVLRC